MGKIVGIDLGTGFSVIAIKESNEIKVIANREGSRTTPSIVAFSDDGTRLIGQAAKNQAVTNPTRTIRCIKRLIGRTRAEVAEDEKLLPYKIVGEPHEDAQVEIDGKRYHPIEISSMILAEMKRAAEDYLGEKVTEAVISVPAYFSDSARTATKTAGEACGLRVLRIINEPTAAALAYGIDKDKDQKIIVLDPGSGTTDCTCLQVGGGLYQVLATCGDLHLGGTDFDNELVDYVAEEFKNTTGVDLRNDQMALQRLVEACERSKCDLSNVQETVINLPYVTAIAGVPKHLTQSITRAKFELLCAPLFERMRKPINQVLQDAKLLPSQIQEVVIVGGSSRIPKFQEMCKEIFGKEPHKGVNADEAIAIGCAIQSGVLSGETQGIVLVDVTPLTLGVETQGGISTPIIQRNTPIPKHAMETFSTFVDSQPAVDIHVLQGERRLSSGNRTLGRFQLTGIPPQPRGQPQVEVSFDIDANGILSVTASDKTSGKKQTVEIKSSSGLSKEEIERMRADAIEHEAEEKDKVLLIEARNRADALVYGTDKFLKENQHLVSPPTAANVAATTATLKAALDANGDIQTLKSGMHQVEVASKRMYEEVYGANAGQAKPVSAAPAMPKPSGVSNVGDVLGGSFKV